MRAPTRLIPKFQDVDRFINKIAVDGVKGCWNWTSAVGVGGYGVFSIQGQTYKAHRVSFSIYVRELNTTLFLDHICRNRLCVNPDHLREVSLRTNIFENSQASALRNSLKKECYRGHPFNRINTYINPRNQRICKECKRANGRKTDAKRRRSKEEATTEVEQSLQLHEEQNRLKQKTIDDLF